MSEASVGQAAVETPRVSNVVGLDGRVFAQTENPQVSATLVGELERLLEAAKVGDIIGMAGSFMHADRLVSYSFAGAVGGFGVIGGLECLKERLVRHALTPD